MKIKLHLNAVIEKIPEGDADNPKFVEWCENKGYQSLVGYRRAWCTELSTYIRDGEYLVELSDSHGASGMKFFATQAELDQLMSGFERPEIPIEPWTEEEIDTWIQKCVDDCEEDE